MGKAACKIGGHLCCENWNTPICGTCYYYYITHNLEIVPTNQFKKLSTVAIKADKKLFLALDSGAHTLHNRFFTEKEGSSYHTSKEHVLNINYDFVKSKQFTTYLDNYIKFLLENKDSYIMYVSLDIIGDAKLSWETLKYIESYGLNPVPVYHHGEDFEWFKKYSSSYEYIGIGGLGHGIGKNSFTSFADRIFNYIAVKDGPPKNKIHIFSLTSNEFLSKYPFYSVDSTTWVNSSRFGRVAIPVPSKREPNKFDFLSGENHSVTVSDRAEMTKGLFATNYYSLSSIQKEHVDKYLASIDFTIEDLKYSYNNRDVANICFYLQVEKQVKELFKEKYAFEQGGNIYLAGIAPSGTGYEKQETLVKSIFKRFDKVTMLPTYWYPRYNDFLLQIFKKESYNNA